MYKWKEVLKPYCRQLNITEYINSEQSRTRFYMEQGFILPWPVRLSKDRLVIR